MTSNKASIKNRTRKVAPTVVLIPEDETTNQENDESSEENNSVTQSVNHLSLISEKYPNKVQKNITYDYYVDQAFNQIKKMLKLNNHSLLVNAGLKNYLKNDPEIQSLSNNNKKLKEILDKIDMSKN